MIGILAALLSSQFQSADIPTWAIVKEARLVREKGKHTASLELSFVGDIPKKHRGSLVAEAFLSRSFEDSQCRKAILVSVFGDESSREIKQHQPDEGLVWSRDTSALEIRKVARISSGRIRIAFRLRPSDLLVLTDVVVRYRKAGSKHAPIWDQGFQHIVYDKSLRMVDEPSFIALVRQKK